MCGIAGSLRLTVDVEAMLDRISHRGPDGRGLEEHGDAKHGHVRLSLLDLSDASAQPFRAGGCTLSYNGELWNHSELRKALQAEGCQFRTTGDTEVVCHALARWGIPGALHKMDGMFGIALSDSHGGHWLIRDRFGKIPLYAERKATGWQWSSERKGFADRGASASPVPPGTFVDLNAGKVHRWYTLPTEQQADPDFVREALRRGVSKRLAADAPVAVLASGGLDSTFILSLAASVSREVTAYTAFVDSQSEDLKAARASCAEYGIRLVEVPVGRPTEQDLIAAIRAIEIPSKAQVEIAALCVPLARRIAADGFKACLSGEAADELFGGYGNMCIRAALSDDSGWRLIREQQLEKMARGNFVRCNKAFMAAGVECRLPFMERELVERVVSTSKSNCPPGKRLLKEAAKGYVPQRIISRQKETFQGASGMKSGAASCVAAPQRFYNAEVRRLFGRLTDS